MSDQDEYVNIEGTNFKKADLSGIKVKVVFKKRIGWVLKFEVNGTGCLIFATMENWNKLSAAGCVLVCEGDEECNDDEAEKIISELEMLKEIVPIIEKHKFKR